MLKEIKFSDPGQPVSEKEVARLEQALGLKLLEAYRSFLLRHNGGGVDETNGSIVIQKGEKPYLINVEYFYAVSDPSSPDYELKERYAQFRGRIPKETISVAHDGFGNQILLGVSGKQKGKVFLWDHEDEGLDEASDPYHNVYLISDSFEGFVNNLGPRQRNSSN